MLSWWGVLRTQIIFFSFFGFGFGLRTYSKLEMKYPKVLKKVLFKVLMKSKVLKSSIFSGPDPAGTGRVRGRQPPDPARPGSPEKCWIFELLTLLLFFFYFFLTFGYFITASGIDS